MPPKKQLPRFQEDDFLDEMVFDDENFPEEDMINTFGQVADASVEHMKVAYRLTRLALAHQEKKEMNPDEIFKIFRKAAETVLDCTPLKALFEKEKS